MDARETQIKLPPEIVRAVKQEAKRTAGQLPEMIVMKEHARRLCGFDNSAMGRIMRALCLFSNGNEHELASVERGITDEAEREILLTLKNVQAAYFQEWVRETVKMSRDKRDYRITAETVEQLFKVHSRLAVIEREGGAQ